MEIQIKKAIKAGNSSAVLLPRSWLNQEVRVELVKKTPETILNDALNIVKKYISLNKIIGVYLVGSYARGEEDSDSDIDILIITDDIDKELIKEGIYNIIVISSELLKQKLRYDLFPIGSMIKEARSLLNNNFLSSIKVKITNENIKWYLETTKDKIEIIKKIISYLKKKNKKYVNDRLVYTLILRIRTLYIIKKLIDDDIYSKKDFLSVIKRITGKADVYNRYIIVKNNLKMK
ncbi:nucleotidyltransferase domain-containing protein, partial [Candidatus Pacearchaeota archaeon]|nr:nucleotidyltransferase domain-containing protein [Candidatus Pacearchaeota archaeon]